MWTQSTSVRDGRTDRIAITKTVQRRASHGNNNDTRNVRSAWDPFDCREVVPLYTTAARLFAWSTAGRITSVMSKYPQLPVTSDSS